MTRRQKYDEQNIEQRVASTYIGRGNRLEGAKLSGSDPIVIDGTYLGDIDLDNTLTVGESGSVIGNVRAKQIIISGKVKGVVFCDGTLHLTSSSYVEGAIASQTIKMDEGARINGQCRMTDEQIENATLELFEIEGKLNFDFKKLGDTYIPESGLPDMDNG
ncbi:MAG: polymer-forming cytoskeletal protein [Oscillospiraceae bacterium]|nr:polymer-forming cytoskeletal protein [Oscillospiraceae bacterium]